MGHPMNRRELLTHSAIAAAGSTLLGASAVCAAEEPEARKTQRRMKLGLVTYNLAREWDLDTIIKNCKEVGVTAVEFRSTHKHGVEPTLTKIQRKDVRKRCEDGGLTIWGIGSACEYHSPDSAVVARNIEESKRFAELAADIGAKGVKVRPNGLPKGVSEDTTLEQIGRSLRTVGEAAASMGVEIWCEMHGSGTCEPPRMRRIMDIANHPNVGVTWNSNHHVDDRDGSIRKHFELMRPRVYSVHINELVCGYPYKELFSLLNETGYDRYTMMEVQSLKSGSVEDTVRFMKFYKALWEAWSGPAA